MKVWLPVAPPVLPGRGLEAQAKVTRQLRQRQLPAAGHQRRPGAQEQRRAAGRAVPLVAAQRHRANGPNTPGRSRCRSAARRSIGSMTPAAASAGCRPPGRSNTWTEATGSLSPPPSGYPVAKDKWCAVRFAPVKTTALRLVVQLPPDFAAGVHEWKVDEGDEDPRERLAHEARASQSRQRLRVRQRLPAFVARPPPRSALLLSALAPALLVLPIGPDEGRSKLSRLGCLPAPALLLPAAASPLGLPLRPPACRTRTCWSSITAPAPSRPSNPRPTGSSGRAEILRGMAGVMGPLPGREKRCPLRHADRAGDRLRLLCAPLDHLRLGAGLARAGVSADSQRSPRRARSSSRPCWRCTRPTCNTATAWSLSNCAPTTAPTAATWPSAATWSSRPPIPSWPITSPTSKRSATRAAP